MILICLIEMFFLRLKKQRKPQKCLNRMTSVTLQSYAENTFLNKMLKWVKITRCIYLKEKKQNNLTIKFLFLNF